jgi:hypothetical protein
MSEQKNFDVPKYYYFQAGNDYLGSLNGLNFKIVLHDEFTVYTYHGSKCFELSEVFQQENFPNSEEGYTSMMSWLENTYLEHRNSQYYTEKLSIL